MRSLRTISNLAVAQRREQGGGDQIGRGAGVPTMMVGAQPEVQVGQGPVVGLISRLAGFQYRDGERERSSDGVFLEMQS